MLLSRICTVSELEGAFVSEIVNMFGTPANNRSANKNPVTVECDFIVMCMCMEFSRKC